MYSKIAEEEDDKMAERWQKDADGLLIFVSRRIRTHTPAHINWKTIDWFILCFGRPAACCVSPGPEARPSGHISILSREYIHASRRTERITPFHYP
jgi:hypothetical protein